MYKTLKNKPLGGGGHPLKRDTIRTRLNLYIERKLHTDKEHLLISHRQDIIFVLTHHFEFSLQEVMDTLPISKAQAYRDKNNAEYFQKHYRHRQEHAQRILEYIIYNARYLN